MDDASERAIEEDMLDQFNYFDDEDEELIDRREPAPLDSFDLVDEEPDEDEGESAEPSQPSRLDSLLSRASMHHGVRAGALHMKTDWHQIVTAGDELAVDAYLVLLASLVFVMLFNGFKQFTDGITDTKTAMWILLGGNVLNIIGNYILIYGKLGLPEMGLLGAGISTLFSRIMMVVVFIIVFMRSPRFLRFKLGFYSLG